MKTKRFGRAMSIFLCLAMIFAVAAQGISTVSAASVFESSDQNFVYNPDFEEDDFTENNRTGHWGTWKTVTRTTEQHYTGEYSAKLNADGASLEQDVQNLTIGVTYIYSIWAKVENANATATIGVKNYDGGTAETRQAVTSTDWAEYSVEFTYTGGSPRVYAYTANPQGGAYYVDNACVRAKSNIKRAEITNGTINVDFVESYTGTPSAADFTAVYSSSANSAPQNLELSGTAADGSIALSFAPIAATAIDQVITVDLTFEGMTITLDYDIPADGSQIVTADLASVSAENGVIKAVLTDNPTVSPVLSDFTLSMTVNGENKNISVSNYSYDPETMTATIEFNRVSSTPKTDRDVNITVVYNEVEKTASYKVAQGTAVTYYVANSGSDSNNGTSEETPFATIDKLNTIDFNPGDQILFKKGDTFVGTFKPESSGAEGDPIIVASYGEGDVRPVIKPGAAWTIPYMISGGGQEANAQVQGCFYFYNVEYWEVHDLELVDPTYDSTFYEVNSVTVFKSGIRVVNQNMGDLTHFYFDNLIIHGFRGPGSNLGKSAGAINFNTLTNPDNPSENIPSAIVDMRVTNCEMYECGRSGINFLNPWARRVGSKWGTPAYGSLDYYPHRDFYMANCIIHDIDGDGLIVDNVDNAVVEYNLCYRTAIHLGTMGAAVGFFNWNSDDTYFQFNEVYDTGLNATQNNGSHVNPGDAMGIEVDALNDRTWVQYNYVHDNCGGFMMWCNIGAGYKGFDAIVRYNISESDFTGSSWGMLRFCGWDYGSEFYNNVMYMDNRSLEKVQTNSNGTANPRYGTLNLVDIPSGNNYSVGHMKLYNNIFYYKDDPVAVNGFADSGANYLDWQANAFYGVTNVPTSRDENHPNFIITDNPFVNPDSGVDGTVPGEICDLTGYQLKEGSVLVNAGIPLASMWDETGGRDYFGNPLTSIPDIGVWESDVPTTDIASVDYSVSVTEKTVTVQDNVTAEMLIDSLVYDKSLKVGVYRGDIKLISGVYLEEGDVINVVDSEGNKIVYNIIVNEVVDDGTIPTKYYNVTAGSQETSSEQTPAENAVDGDNGTMWHTKWDDADRNNHYITIELTKAHNVTGYTYLPRQTGVNGIITQYQILSSNDNQNWDLVKSGEWTNDVSLKTVTFDSPVNAKYFRLKAENAAGGSFASAAEIRLIGERIIDESDIPDAPVNVKNSRTSGTSAEITWEAPEENENIVKYVIKNGDDTLGTVSADTFSYIIGGLTKNTEYTIGVYSADEDGILSEVTTVVFSTNSGDGLIQPIEAIMGDVNHDEAINAGDATLALQRYAGIIGDDYENYDPDLADVNGDGKVDVSDATLMLQMYAGIITVFPVA